MPKNEALDEFLGDLAQPVEDPFKPEEDPFAQKEEETIVSEEDKVQEEKPVPFHKDPKVQRYVEKQIQKALETVKPSEAQQFLREVGEEEDDVVDVLSRIIGNDTPEKIAAVKDFRKALAGVEERGAQKALAQLQKEAEQKREQEKNAEDELTAGFESIEEEFSVDISSNVPQARKHRAEFIEYIKKIAPKDEYGEIEKFPDFLGAYESFQDSKKNAPATSSRAKELASRSLSRSSDSSSTSSPKPQTWKEVDAIFNKLG